MRTFTSGATRDTDDEKLDYEGFLSPLVLERYAEYMHQNRKTEGGLRASDNWQRGIPLSAYMKSLWRHFMDVWKLHRGVTTGGTLLEDALCAVLFNASGYLHEVLRRNGAESVPASARVGACGFAVPERRAWIIED